MVAGKLIGTPPTPLTYIFENQLDFRPPPPSTNMLRFSPQATDSESPCADAIEPKTHIYLGQYPC